MLTRRNLGYDSKKLVSIIESWDNNQTPHDIVGGLLESKYPPTYFKDHIIEACLSDSSKKIVRFMCVSDRFLLDFINREKFYTKCLAELPLTDWMIIKMQFKSMLTD